MENPALRWLPRFFLPLAVLALPVAAHADLAQAPAKDAQVARLLEAKKTLHWNRSYGNDRYGHAEALVDAPIENVAKAAADFGHYRELHRKFSTARVVAKEGDQTDVYMRYPVQIGLLKIEMSEVIRFSPPRANGASQVIEGRGLKGDMKRAHTVITVRAVDAKHSIVEVDILLVPTMFAPQSYIDEELRDGAYDFIDGLKDRAQGWRGSLASL